MGNIGANWLYRRRGPKAQKLLLKWDSVYDCTESTGRSTSCTQSVLHCLLPIYDSVFVHLVVSLVFVLFRSEQCILVFSAKTSCTGWTTMTVNQPYMTSQKSSKCQREQTRVKDNGQLNQPSSLKRIWRHSWKWYHWGVPPAVGAAYHPSPVSAWRSTCDG